MEYNGEDIRKAQMEQRQRILKSFGETNLFSGEGDSNKLMRSMEKAEENDIEKAKHQDGDMHPNGRWVWRQSANGGKGDWRVANPKRGGGSRAAASSSKTTSSSSDSKTTSSEGNETTQKTSSTPKKTDSKKKDDDSVIASELKKELDKNVANSEKSIAKIFEKIDGINFKKNFYGEIEAVVGEYNIKEGGSASYLILSWDSGLRTTLNHVGNQGVRRVHNGAMVLKIRGGYDLHRITLSGKTESELKGVIELVTKIKNLKRKDLLSISGFGEKDKLTNKVREIINDYNNNPVSKTTASKKTDSSKKAESKTSAKKEVAKKKVPSGKKVSYDDDIVAVYDDKGKKVYEGMLDYSPYQLDDSKWNEKDKNYDLPKGYKMVGK